MRSILLHLFALLLLSTAARAASLVPVRTDNPRDTMQTFMTAVDDYKEGVQNNDKHQMKRINDAVRCFNFEGMVGITSDYRRETAILTREHNGRAACHWCGPCNRGCQNACTHQRCASVWRRSIILRI